MLRRWLLSPKRSSYLADLPDGIERIRLTSPGGLAVNAWLVRAPDGWVLVDSGWTYTAETLVVELEQRGLTLQDIHAVFYTHTHEDHMGGGVVLDEALAGRHVIAEGTSPAEGNYYDFYDNLERWNVWMERALPPSPMRDVILDFRRRRPPRDWRTGGSGALSEPLWITHHEEILIAGLHWTCVPVPGHDPWHVAWYVRETGWMFTGDVLLGSPTPIVAPNLDRLDLYERSLRSLEAFPQEVTVTLPGHGRPFDGLVDGVFDARDNLTRVRDAIRHAAATDPVLNPGLVAATLLHPERPDMKRGYVWLFNVFAQLDTWAEEGRAERVEDGRLFRLLDS